MDKLIIAKDLSPYDGEYEFELGELLGSLDHGELHRIKLLTKLRAGELGEAFAAEDSDVIVGLAAVILERRGFTVVDDILWSAKLGSMKLDLGVEENPPETAQETPQSEPESEPQTLEQSASSGNDTRSDSDHPANGQSPTGHPASLKSVTSDQETSAA